MVYVIEAKNGDESTFKIGYTIMQTARDRMLQIQRSHPHDLQVVAGIFGNKEDEEFFHRAFRPYRIRGEWFKDCYGIRKLIEDFPILKYRQMENSLVRKGITFEEFFLETTMLKFEEPKVIKKVLKAKGAEWRAIFPASTFLPASCSASTYDGTLLF